MQTETYDATTEHDIAAMPAPAANQMARRDFGGMSLSRDNQATAALVAKARADIEARWTMAMHRPRNMDQVRATLMLECRRPGFADAAIYAKPVGGDDTIEGLSIRFAEVAARAMGNIAIDQAQIYDDDRTRIIRVSVTDLEANVTWPTDVTVAKTVERKFLRKGQKPLASRPNSYGEQVYIVEASEDALLTKQAALVSKAVRTCILRVVPGHLQDEAMAVCKAVLADKTAKDPDAARNKLVDAFSRIGVTPLHLGEYLGHDLATASPAELQQLIQLGATIRDGETTWAEVMDGRSARQAAPAGDAAAPAKAATGKGTAALKGKLAKPAAAPATAPATAPAPAPADDLPKWAGGTAPNPGEPTAEEIAEIERRELAAMREPGEDD